MPSPCSQPCLPLPGSNTGSAVRPSIQISMDGPSGAKGMLKNSSAPGAVVQHPPHPVQVVFQHLQGTCSPTSPCHLHSAQRRRDLLPHSQLQSQSDSFNVPSGIQGDVYPSKPRATCSDLPFRADTTLALKWASVAPSAPWHSASGMSPWALHPQMPPQDSAWPCIS